MIAGFIRAALAPSAPAGASYPRVEFRDNDQRLTGIVELVDGAVVPRDEKTLEFLAETLVVEAGDPPRPLTLADGERYLRALPKNFAGMYSHAILIENDSS
jgi:hypothetical protein